MNAKTKNNEILQKVSHSIHIADAMNECLWLGDRNHRTIYVNPVYEKMSGYSLQECIGKPADFCFDKKSKKIIEKHHKLRSKGEASQYEATMVSKGGKKIPLLISGAPTSEGGTIGIFTNLTKLKKLTRSQKLTEQIIQNSLEAIVILDKNRHIKLWNTGAAKTFGHKEEEVLNKPISEILVPKNRIEENRQIVEEVEKTGSLNSNETKRKAKNGELIDVSVTVKKVADEKEHFIGYLLIYRDISERKRASEQLQKRFEAMQDAYKELGLQKRQMDYLSELTDMAISSSTLAEIEKLIVSAICMLTKCDAAVLRKYDPKTKSLKFKCSIGVDTKWQNKSKIDFKGSIAEEAFNARRPLIRNNIDKCPKHQGLKLVKTHKFKTLLSLPLYFNNEIKGSLSLYATDPAKFRFLETDFLEKFAKQCALSLYAKNK